MPIALYKPIGMTPLECISAYVSTHPELASQTVSYAGRLDPMAEGVLLMLVGAENKQRREHEHLEKEYIIEVLWGMSTDSGDVLGLPQVASHTLSPEEVLEQCRRSLQSFVGTYDQRYHPYSARRVQGKPLYWWMRQGRMAEITLPTHSITISELAILGHELIAVKALQNDIQERIGLIHGDFRQDEICTAWHDVFQKETRQLYLVTRLRAVNPHGGAYMRVLVEDLAREVGASACCLQITRTRVGGYIA